MVHAIDAEVDSTRGVKRIGAGITHNGGNKGIGIKAAMISLCYDF